MDLIELRDIEVNCVVGLYPTERQVPQPLRLDVAMSLDTEPAARRESLGASVDYASIATQLRFLLQSCRFRMLETAAHALACYLLAPPAPGEKRAQLERVRIRLEKPKVLEGIAIPSLTIERDKGFATMLREDKPFGIVEIIHETRDAGIYRLNLTPGASIPLHVHHVMQESELVLSEGLWCQGKPVLKGTAHRWPKNAAHSYHNPTDRMQSILCVDSPRFIEGDEIAVQGEPAEVQPEAGGFQ
ncbi:MAG TPA: dihydroneopterin aldolase [Polyangiales bacterium]|nr:dihydroneopterin aldolase [Polyangiales bacterium]